MPPKLNLEARVTIGELLRRGWSRMSIASTLGVTEGAVRYHERRTAVGATDGRVGRQPHKAADLAPQVEAWLERQRASGVEGALNLVELHEHLVAEHGYTGSLRSIQRYYRVHYPPPPRRTRRRVETPPGAQAQVDWARFADVRIGGIVQDLWAFLLVLSWSRFSVLVWAYQKHQLSWHQVHLASFERIGGIPASLRIDNEKTAMARGGGPWGTINPTYRRFSELQRFHIDACLPRAPEAKGKVERRVRDSRTWVDPRQREWWHLDELQSWTDERMLERTRRRRCPQTGGSCFEAWEVEQPLLGELAAMPRPFDVVVSRPVGLDCTVHFEGRVYSVPFVWSGRFVEVYGCAEHVEIRVGSEIVAEHPRGTDQRILLNPAHFEGEATDTVLPPMPLGRMGRRLEEIAAMVPEQRPLDLYAALAEVAR